jgi:hypothetical protein
MFDGIDEIEASLLARTVHHDPIVSVELLYAAHESALIGQHGIDETATLIVPLLHADRQIGPPLRRRPFSPSSEQPFEPTHGR